VTDPGRRALNDYAEVTPWRSAKSLRCLRTLVSPGGQRWQRMQSLPRQQPPGFQYQAHGRHSPVPCKAEPALDSPCRGLKPGKGSDIVPAFETKSASGWVSTTSSEGAQRDVIGSLRAPSSSMSWLIWKMPGGYTGDALVQRNVIGSVSAPSSSNSWLIWKVLRGYTVDAPVLPSWMVSEPTGESSLEDRPLACSCSELLSVVDSPSSEMPPVVVEPSKEEKNAGTSLGASPLLVADLGVDRPRRMHVVLYFLRALISPSGHR